MPSGPAIRWLQFRQRGFERDVGGPVEAGGEAHHADTDALQRVRPEPGGKVGSHGIGAGGRRIGRIAAHHRAEQQRGVGDAPGYGACRIATAALAATHRLADVTKTDFDAVFYRGGHGPLWDLANDARSIALIEGTLAASKPVGLVCHAPGVLKNAHAPDGAPLVRGRRVAGFTNGEEAAVGFYIYVRLREGCAKTPF